MSKHKLSQIIIILIITFIFYLLSSNLLWAKGAGSSSGITLLRPISPKAAGIAEACSSMQGEITAIYYNPAGLAAFRGTEFSATYQRGLANDNLAALVIGQNLSTAVLGAAFIYYTTGKVDLYDTTGFLINRIGQQDIIFILGSATNYKKLSVGLNLKYITSEIFGYRAFAFAVDSGIQFKFSDNINTGLCLQNLGTKLEYLKADEKLPLIIRSAVSWNYKDYGKNFIFAIDLPYYVNEEELLMSIGAQTTFEKQLSIRVGYKINLTHIKNIDEKLNIGWGINFKKLQFNHSIGITSNLNIPQNFSVSIKF